MPPIEAFGAEEDPGRRHHVEGDDDEEHPPSHAPPARQDALRPVLVAEEALDGEGRAVNPPQTTKVHLAPCQRPPSSIVSIRFPYVRQRPCRLPPSGMYR